MASYQGSWGSTEVNVRPSLGQPASQPRLKLHDVRCRGDSHVKVEDELVGDDVDLDPALTHGEVHSGHVPQGQVRVRLESLLLQGAEVQQFVDHLPRLLGRGVLEES